MKNLGMTGGLALVAAGLLANVFVTLDDDVQAGAVFPIFSGGDTEPCHYLPEERWFEQSGQVLDICTYNPMSIIPNFNDLDIDGNGTIDRIKLGNLFWNASNGSFNDSDYLQQRSYSIEKVNGVWGTAVRPLDFDYSELVPSTKSNLDVNMFLCDIDGDKKPDLIVNMANSIAGINQTTWHRNITAGDALAADINLDGRVDGIDLAIVLGSWTSSG